ncbi:MAG: helix-turn-helix domain-containing protein, partial [Polyangiaceae bacterium]
MTHDGLAARHGRHTRQRILREARRLFAQHGYADASMSGVAHAVGCSKAAISAHFANKRALYEGVL